MPRRDVVQAKQGDIITIADWLQANPFHALIDRQRKGEVNSNVPEDEEEVSSESKSTHR